MPDTDHDALQVDWNRLSTKCGRNEQFVAELIDEFRRQTPILVRRIKSALDRTDLAVLADATHTLKGSCLTLEARSLVHLCKELEHAAAESRLAECRRLITDIDAMYPGLCSLLESRVLPADTP